MTKRKILLLCGGGGAEHSISLLSADYIESQLLLIDDISVIRVTIEDGSWTLASGESCFIDMNKMLNLSDGEKYAIDYVIPCIHGFPGETGDLQSLFDMVGLAYLGCNAESSTLCFNKISSKLWFDAVNIDNTPYLFLSDKSDVSIKQATAFFEQWGKVFVKAASQGSSVGCYCVEELVELVPTINEAFNYSEQVLIEKAVTPRELEVAAYEFQGKLIVTKPGEVCSPDNAFYSYEEKYSSDSHSSTVLEATNLTDEQLAIIDKAARHAFTQLKLSDLSRIDFFLTEEGEILLNEINTFPGMTPISMFPKLMENNGHQFKDFLEQAIKS
ncbi:D-alanine--D-alanine ligase [Vibrio sp. SS-MA-C1-2]|uniref:D-alanine--D-alanine ligase n=1 Tax=Vibrio sp. SS-MA-C1-2 TaxID=2908646 RepID=UPI001F31DB8B|nr:D-alanine--D-alanine ligase [Vibrio sp. SS-MA-C1-2]UJF17297.1 D-alanine--D-alanine ligase [Vibrio sp. SS-MA-C1-2]